MHGDRVVRELADRLAATERRLHALETGARAPFTSVQGGRTRWLDDEGREAVAIGVDEDGRPFIRAWNGERSAPVFEVAAGRGTFPLTVSPWQPSFTTNQDALGFRFTSSGVATPAWKTIISLVTSELHFDFSGAADSGATSGELSFAVQGLGSRSTGSLEVVSTVFDITTTFPQTIDGTFTVPSSILTAGGDVVGELVQVFARIRVDDGAGEVRIAPAQPLYCTTT